MLTTLILFSLISLQATPKTVWDGVYTQAQATRGEAAYGEACSRCHRDDLSGYNSVLLGGRFMDRWREDSLNSFFRNIQKTMPRDAPASLSDDAYLDIVAFIMKKNEFPMGKNALTLAALPDIRVQSKQGPEAVPDFSLVEVQGCLTQDPSGAWQVIEATEPVRTRNPAAEELTPSRNKAPGAHTFRMMDMESLQSKPVRNQFVQAKGFLIRQPNDDRINLTSLQTIAPACQ